MENPVKLISIYSNLLIFLLKSTLPHNLFMKKAKGEIENILGNIFEEEKGKMTANVKQIQEAIVSFLKKAVQTEKEEENELTVIRALINFIFLKFTEEQKKVAESELFSTGNGNFYRCLLIDILKIDETVAKVGFIKLN